MPTVLMHTHATALPISHCLTSRTATRASRWRCCCSGARCSLLRTKPMCLANACPGSGTQRTLGQSASTPSRMCRALHVRSRIDLSKVDLTKMDYLELCYKAMSLARRQSPDLQIAVDLSENTLGRKQLDFIFTQIASEASALFLRYCEYPEGLSLTAAPAKRSTLQILSLCGVRINDNSELLPFLESVAPCLRELDLCGVGLGASLAKFVTFLSSTSIEHLDLSFCNLWPSKLGELSRLTQLKRLNLGHNDLDGKDVKELIEQHLPPSIEQLSLKSNDLQISELGSLRKGFERLSKLTLLVLAYVDGGAVARHESRSYQLNLSHLGG
eukprot:m.24008 g.24008  ORF g.24008 m.24008 type:complete len:328 (-) comp4203_c0_seq1:817-1800(-)